MSRRDVRTARRLPGLLLAAMLPWTAALASGPAQAGNLLGMGIGAPLDWGKDRIYADVIRMARDFSGAPVDSDGWPLGDARLEVWAGPPNMHGSYALSFQGRAERVTGGDGVTDLRYDPATNTSTATVVVKVAESSALYLSFFGTRRTPASPTNSGITRIKLMRPLTPGSAVSYPPTELFHLPLRQLVSKVQVVRFMDFLSIDNNQQRTWAERTFPGAASYQRHLPNDGWQGNGGPWEHVVLFANEVGKDAWINIPAKADDDYVRRVALLLRHGSDGVDPYGAPQAHPVFPPLRPDLKVYLEYSNEVWNASAGFAVQATYNHEQAVAEVKAGRSPLAFDGMKDPGGWTYGWRRIAKRTVELSRIFRAVFGDAEMMTRIRPVVMTQQGNEQDTLQQVLRLLHGYYNNGEGDFVPDPHPPGYYVWGAGGSAYYNPDNAAADLTLDGFWSSQTMDVANWRPFLRKDADRVAAMGVRRVAYEGGPSLDKTGKGEAVKAQAWSDPRMTGALVAHHDTWSAFGGDLLVYFTAAHDYQWGFTQDIHALDTPKLRALDELGRRPAAPITHGTPLPATLAGDAFGVSSRSWDRPGTGSRGFTSGDPNEKFVWASYTLRSDSAGSREVALVASSVLGGKLAVYWDGRLLGTRELGFSRRVTIPVGRVEAGPGLHGLIVRAVSGGFTLEELSVR